MSQRPKFSVVIPTFDRADLVMEAVGCVLGQTYTDLELIVVDDHSTDDTLNRLGSVTDARLKVLTNRRAKGGPGARNTGILEASGEWLCQLDSDDLWSSDMLEKLAAAIETAGPEVGIVYGSYAKVDIATGEVLYYNEATRRGRVYPLILEDYFFTVGSAAVRMSAIDEVGLYDETLLLNEDTDLQLRLTERYELLPVPAAVHKYRSGGHSRLTTDYASKAVAYRQFIDKHGALLRHLPRESAHLHHILLTVALRNGSWNEVRSAWWHILPAAWHAPRRFARYHVSFLRETRDHFRSRRATTRH